jgi:hypothetical protein
MIALAKSLVASISQGQDVVTIVRLTAGRCIY